MEGPEKTFCVCEHFHRDLKDEKDLVTIIVMGTVWVRPLKQKRVCVSVKMKEGKWCGSIVCEDNGAREGRRTG